MDAEYLMKTFFLTIISGLASIFFIVILTATNTFAEGYDRSVFNFHSYKPDTSIGFYTNQSCDFINIDHVVSLKDAYDSGAASWGNSKKNPSLTIGSLHAAA